VEPTNSGHTTLELECLKVDYLEISCLIRRIEARSLKKHCDDIENLEGRRQKTLQCLIAAIKQDTRREFRSSADDNLATVLLLDLAEKLCPRPNHHSLQLGPVNSLWSNLLEVEVHLKKNQLAPSELSERVAKELRIFSEWALVTKRKLRQAT